ncbi:hypothetical protein JW964_09540 [candidate division KSB1 bacterium]|nr:hypothetical protein [candidate division KSB1 bacterium]
MKNIVPTIVFVLIGVGLTLVLNYFLCSKPSADEFQRLKAQITSQIDSLNNVIKTKEDSLMAIRTHADAIEQKMAELGDLITAQKKTIETLKKRRFVYEGSSDNLLNDLNSLYKRSLAEDSSATDRVPR